MQDLDLRRAKRILYYQMLATLGVAALGLLAGPKPALYALIGGTTALAGNALFAFWVFGGYRAAEPRQLLAQIYGGEIVKILFIVGVFAAVFIGMDGPDPLALMLAFFVVQVLPPLLASRIAG